MESAWLSFNALVSQHTAAMGKFDSSGEIANVLSAIQSVAQMSRSICSSVPKKGPQHKALTIKASSLW